MRVVIDNIVFSLQRCGGISGMFCRLIDGLINDPEIDLWILEHENASSNIFRNMLHSIPQERIIKMKGYPLILERYRKINDLPGFPNPDKPFVFHSSYYRYCTLPGAVNVTTVHDFTYEVMRLRGTLSTVIHSWQKKQAIIHSKALACVSHATAKDLNDFAVVSPDCRIKIIPNAPLCSTKLSEPSGRDMKKVLFVGARAYHKNFAKVVDALSGTGWQLVLCSSPISSAERKNLKKKLRPEQWEHIIYPDDATLSRLYRSCRCLIYPSSYEGFGIPIIEAQAHGMPVITGKCPASLEVAAGSSIVLDDYSPESIRKAISSLDDLHLYDKLIAAGIKNSSRFSWEEIISMYKKLYSNALQDK